MGVDQWTILMSGGDTIPTVNPIPSHPSPEIERSSLSPSLSHWALSKIYLNARLQRSWYFAISWSYLNVRLEFNCPISSLNIVKAQVVAVMYNECGLTSHVYCLDCRKQTARFRRAAVQGRVGRRSTGWLWLVIIIWNIGLMGQFPLSSGSSKLDWYHITSFRAQWQIMRPWLMSLVSSSLHCL